jgi:hypothetical protein
VAASGVTDGWAAANSLLTGKIAGALPKAASKPLKSADKARRRAEKAGNPGGPNREAFAAIREIRWVYRNRFAFEKEGIAKIYIYHVSAFGKAWREAGGAPV